MRSRIHSALNANQSRVVKRGAYRDRVRRNYPDTAISDFEKLLECVNECETQENSFLLGAVETTLNGDT
jgi:hypothetical protein